MANKSLGLDHIIIDLYNFKQAHFGHIDDEDVRCLRSTHLFDKVHELFFYEILEDVVKCKCAANSVIIEENKPCDAFYIIEKGKVNVCSLNGRGEKKIVNQLNECSYFGEHTLLDEVDMILNTSWETVTEVTLLKIDFPFLISVLRNDRCLIKQFYKNLASGNLAKVK